MAFKILNTCISCSACASACPVGCIYQGEEQFIIRKEECIHCGTCEAVCPVGAPVPDEE